MRGDYPLKARTIQKTKKFMMTGRHSPCYAQIMATRPDISAPCEAARPLARHLLFRTTSLDEARDRVGRIFCPHRLDRIGHDRMDVWHNHVRGERLSLNYLEYGAKTLIAPGELGSFYLLQIPLQGGATISCGSEHYYSAPNAAAILNPHQQTTMIWEEGTRQILVQIDRKALQTHLANQLGAHIDRAVSFKGALDLGQGPGLMLRNLILHMVGEVDAGRMAFGAPGLMNQQLESTIMTGLLEALPHNYSHLMGRNAAGATPRHLRLAESYIDAHLDCPLTIETIAEAASTTPRTLQLSFRAFRNTTPLRFMRDRRLLQTHHDLMSGRPDISVTDIATRWGFTHLGRFSQLYRERFGLSPSETLRAARGPKWKD